MNADAPGRQRTCDAASPRIRLATAGDLPALLAIRNWAIASTAACFAAEPETLAAWQGHWSEKCSAHPWSPKSTAKSSATH